MSGWFSGVGGIVVVEAGVIAGYLIAWALRKAQRVGRRLDAEADTAIDAGLDWLHEVVAEQLSGHPALVELVQEANQAGQVTDLTRQQVELAVMGAARKNEAFALAVAELAAHLQATERMSRSVIAGTGSAVFTGDARADARDGGIAFGQVAGNVSINREEPDPPKPGRPGH